MNGFSPKNTNVTQLPSGEEQRLWETFRKGDLRAYERIFNLFYRDLYGYGLKLSSCPDVVRDCIQSLFVTLWERREHLGEIRSIKAYLLTSLRRKILKKVRQQRQNHPVRPNTENALIPMIQQSSEDVWIADEAYEARLKALRQAFEVLPERQREILFLKYFNGMSYREIEDILSINYQSIRNHVYRALQTLRDQMSKEDLANTLISFFLLLIPYGQGMLG